VQSRFGRLSVIDSAIYSLLAAYGLLALLALALLPARFLPAEDAIILFQYSRNLAEHGAITFLANGPHVEGATDFAWMALVALGLRLHIPAFWFCAGVNAFALIALGALLLKLAGQRLSPLRLLVVMGAISLVPQIVAAGSGFAVLPDAVLLTSLVFAVTKKRPAEAALIALAFCLFRPDGVVFAVPFLVSLIIPQQARLRNACFVLGLFVVPGVLYFVWRWRYFGELLPLPFLVKADTHRVFGLFVPLSLHQSLSYLVFAGTLVLLVALRQNTPPGICGF
jgi:hypothetical protein